MTEAIQNIQPEPLVHGSNTLLLGATGTGKTHALQTFLAAGKEVFVLATEPGIVSTLGNTPKDKLHWHYIPPANVGWDDILDSAKKINTLSYESLAKMSDVNKRKYGQFMEVINSCNNFICDRTGEAFGDVATWDSSRVFVIDSLSGLNIMAMSLVVGSKPTKAMHDWMVAQDNLERFLTKLLTDTSCYFVLTGHMERETDEITGGVKLMASTLGKKLAPKLSRFFDDVVMCQRNGTVFTWTTINPQADLKARNLPLADNIPPSFTHIVHSLEGEKK